MSYPRELDEYADVELAGEIERRKATRAKGLCDYCNRPVKEESCRFPLRHRPVAKIDASGSGFNQASAYKEVTARLAKCVGFWLVDHPEATAEQASTDADLDKRADRVSPGFSGGMWSAAVREAFRQRDEGALRAWLGLE